MTLRRLLPFAILLAAGADVFGQSVPPPVPVRPVVRFISPSPEDLPLGETRIEVELIGEQPEEVDFFVDGRKIGTVEKPPAPIGKAPWWILWEAGDTPRQHLITVALLRDGREVATASLRTREAGFTYAPTVHAVGISPIVTDQNGRPVPGLSPKDFLVFDEGQIQKIETFDSTDSPMAVILALDTSGSMLARRDDARRAAHAFLDALRPEDEAGICTFNSAIVETASEVTQDRQALHDRIDKGLPEGETSIYDVVAAALRRLKHVKRRKAVVLFTDALDNRSRLSVNQVIEMSRVAEVSVFSVALGADESKAPMVFLNRLAEETGGRSYLIRNIRKLPEVLHSLLTELKSQYFLTYTPRNLKSHSLHRVEVRVLRPNVVVRSRKEYVIE
jgi:Ca-activated chloride channel family protein